MSRILKGTLFCAVPMFAVLLLGFSWGGIVGLILSALFLTIFFSFLIFACDSIVRKAHNANPVSAKDSLGLTEIVTRLATKAGVPTPAVYIVADDAPFVFSAGRGLYQSSIVVSSGLLALLDYRELEGVIAYEVTRIRDSGAYFGTFLAAAMLVMLMPFPWLGRRGGQIPVFLLAPVVMSIAKVLQGGLSSFSVDRKTVALTGNAGALAMALRKIDNHLHHATNPLTLPLRLAAGHLYIVSPVVEHPWISWFMGVRAPRGGSKIEGSIVNRRIYRLLQLSY